MKNNSELMNKEEEHEIIFPACSLCLVVELSIDVRLGDSYNFELTKKKFRWDGNESFSSQLCDSEGRMEAGGGGGCTAAPSTSKLPFLRCHHDIISWCCWLIAQSWRCIVGCSSKNVFAVTQELFVTRGVPPVYWVGHPRRC